MKDEINANAAKRDELKSAVAAADAPQPRLRIVSKGNLAAMLEAAQNAKRSPETVDLSLQVVMVARACNQRYLQL